MMILVDTNILIYYFNGLPQARQFLTAHAGNLAVSTVTVAEVLSYPSSDDTIKAMQQFLRDNFTWLDASCEIMLKSATLRRQKKIKLPDAIIGATAIHHQCSLVSRNERDFKHLAIDLINPIDSIY